MANIRVTCPTCKQELEIDERYDGQEVECGSCLQVFVAEGPNSKKKSPPAPAGKKPYKARRDPDEDRDDGEDDEPRRKKKRRRDDDDDFDYDDRPPSRGGVGAASILALVVGILAFLSSCCWPASIVLGIISQILGGIGMRNPNGKGMAVAGMILGGIGLLVGLGFLAFTFAGNVR